MLDELTQQIVQFRDERDWKQYHSPRNLAASITIEAAELLELFQWSSDESMSQDVETRRTDIEREVADVLIYTLLLAHDTGVDVVASVTRKLAATARAALRSSAAGTSMASMSFVAGRA